LSERQNWDLTAWSNLIDVTGRSVPHTKSWRTLATILIAESGSSVMELKRFR